jgi:hypothetical protein
LSIEKYYKSLVIKEQVTTGGSFGTPAFNTVGTYKGFIQPVLGSEHVRNGKGQEEATHRLYTSLSTPFKYGYIVTQNSIDYMMLYGTQPSGISGKEHHKEILMGLYNG